MMLRALTLAALLAAAPAAAKPPSAAQTLATAIAAYSHGDYPTARPRLQTLANRGSAIAETLLGVMAAKGQGRSADPASAVAYWMRAANRGYAPAQLALAKALARGSGTSADPGAAWVWARLAAAGTDPMLAVAAAQLADGLEPQLGGDRLTALEAKRAAWRPWAG